MAEEFTPTLPSEVETTRLNGLTTRLGSGSRRRRGCRYAEDFVDDDNCGSGSRWSASTTSRLRMRKSERIGLYSSSSSSCLLGAKSRHTRLSNHPTMAVNDASGRRPTRLQKLLPSDDDVVLTYCSSSSYSSTPASGFQSLRQQRLDNDDAFDNSTPSLSSPVLRRRKSRGVLAFYASSSSSSSSSLTSSSSSSPSSSSSSSSSSTSSPSSPSS